MVTKENDQPAAAVPRESMAGARLVENDSPTVPPSSAELGAPVAEENDQPAAAVPRESMADARLVEREAPAVATPAPAPTLPAPPPAVRVLPRRPRLRATFHYDAEDRINVELTLMDERRNLIHRATLTPAPSGVIARIFEALLGVVTQAASHAGVFGSRER